MYDFSKVEDRRKFRNTNIWKSFRKALILARGKCDKCSKTNCKLQLHHLDSKNYDDLDPAKFKLLCGKCHDYEHGK